MAGRGRGRGRGLSFDVEALGFSRGDALPTPNVEPPPQFPAPLFKPVPLLTGESYDYILALKQELRGSFRDSGFFIPQVSLKKDIMRYSDKYQQEPAENQVYWDWNLFPKELVQKSKMALKKIKPAVKKHTTEEIDIKEKFTELESKEITEGDDEPQEKKKKNPDEEEDEIENEETYEDEELEEETDYAMNYFDNGENYLDEEDDNLDDGAIY